MLRSRTAAAVLALAAAAFAAAGCGSGSAALDQVPHRTIPSTSGATTTSAQAAASASPEATGAPAGPVSLSIRQVYETNTPGMGPPGTDVTDPDALAPPAPSASPAAYVVREAQATVTPPSAAPANSGPVEITPSPAELAAYATLDCSEPDNQRADSGRDHPNEFLVTCGAPDGSSSWHKFLLHPTLIQGRDIANAAADDDTQNGNGWSVQLTFASAATNRWANFTAGHIGTLIAIVVDGDVISAETIQGAITGPTQITGNFTKATATALAHALRQGAAS